MAPRQSSAVAAAGYDADGNVLRVRYVGGATYDYLGVPGPVFEAFELAESKGRFVNLVIKPNYPYRAV